MDPDNEWHEGKPLDLSHVDVSSDPRNREIIERFMAGLLDGEVTLEGYWLGAPVPAEVALIAESDENPN